jgi:tape measure domain-containing protein
MLGSADKAKDAIKGLRDFSASTPFQFEGIAQSARQLLAFGVTSDELQGKLKFLGDIASGAGVPLNDMAAIFGKAKAKGKAMTEELLQMSDRGVPIIKVLGERLGKTGEEIFDMASKGEISFDILESALKSMSEEGGIFFNLMDERSKTLSGRLSTLKDNIINASVPLGNAFLPIIESIAEKLIPLVEKLGQWIEKHPQLTKYIALSVLGLTGLVTVLGILGLAVGLITSAVTTLGITMAGVLSATGLGLIIGGAILLGNALKDLIATTYEVEVTWKDVWNEIIDFTSDIILGIIKIFDKLAGVFDKIKNGAKGVFSSIKSGASDIIERTANVINVNDAIITPKGDVVKPASDDYLIATKNPNGMGGQTYNFDFTNATITNKEQFINDIKTQLGRGLQLKQIGI